MADPEHPGLRGIVAGVSDGASDPERHRRFVVEKLGASKDFASRVLRAAASKGRRAVRLTGLERALWEEELAFTLVLLGLGGAIEVEATNADLDRLVKVMEDAARAIRDVALADGHLIDLEMRLRLHAFRLRRAPRRARGHSVERGNHRAEVALLRLYKSAFGREPGSNPHGPAARFVHEAWSVVAHECRINEKRKQKIGTPEAAVKRVIRRIDEARREHKELKSKNTSRPGAPQMVRKR